MKTGVEGLIIRRIREEYILHMKHNDVLLFGDGERMIRDIVRRFEFFDGTIFNSDMLQKYQKMAIKELTRICKLGPTHAQLLVMADAA